MKEHPISFNSEMVQATLLGNKTQVRKPFKDKLLKRKGVITIDDCPYGRIGNRLWVRESFCMGVFKEDYAIPLDDCHLYVDDSDSEGEKQYPIYKQMVLSQGIYFDDVRWRSPSLMPRSASRILLEITDIRIEFLNDISKEDAKAEGFDYSTHPSAIKMGYAIGAKTNFRHAWQEIYGANCWAENPLVWVIEFRVIGGDQ